MRIKLDENIPRDLKIALGPAHDVDTVHEEGLSGADDSTVWSAAQREQRLLVTQDLDFSDLRRYTPGAHSGVLLIRLRSPSRRALRERLSELARLEAFDSWAACFVVVTDAKVRVRRAPAPA